MIGKTKVCTCILEPKGDFGLEGFMLDAEYDCFINDKTGINLVVLKTESGTETLGVSKTTFSKYFEVI